ncbi:MAG TPA: protein kinase [Thermoanaerobaculia bacterium]|nr:protein kinase [Thermoanaerobaculia bacterium]
MGSDSLRPFGSSGLGPGMVLDGKYEILNRLGAGGMGEVFKARHVHLNTFRCIKVMKQSLLEDETVRNRFLREARLATQIHHPNIAVVHDFFLGEGGSYMVTEFIDGTTVRQWSAAYGPFPLALAADVASQVLAGLDHIHRRGLLHRDISPDNIMLAYDSDDRLIAKIIDLGIAKDTTSTVSADTTQAGILIGNPKYMSPEQFGQLDDGESLDGRADLYCLGVVLYEMLLGVPPFISETPQGYIMKHLTAKPRRFAEARPGTVWSDGVEQIIFRALEKNREQRFGDARAFAVALERFLIVPAGTLSRDVVSRLRRGSERATLNQPLQGDTPTIADTPIPAAEATVAVDTTKTEENAFHSAFEHGSSTALRAFLDAYPKSVHADRARKMLEETLAFETAAKSETETGLREFLKMWPEGRHHLEAEIRLVELKERLAEQAFAQAVAADSYAAVRDFQARFPASPRIEEAKRIAAERLAFESASADDSEDAWETYLASWKDGPHAGDARTRLENARAREEEAYREASDAKTAAAWDAFLAKHPHGKRNARAQRNRREAAAFEEARAGGRAAMQDFVRRHADGLLVKDAQRLLRQMQDDDDFAHAQSMDKPAAWQLYLATHPGGAHASAAREQLTALEDAAFASLLSSKNVKAGAQFLTDYPDSPRRDEVKRLTAKWRESVAVQEALDAIAAGDVARAESLLAQVADPARQSEIQAALEAAHDRMSWDEATRAESTLSLRSYIEARPDGRWATEARKRLSKLEVATQAAEPGHWNDAWERGTIDAWDRYLAAHPDSARIEEARRWRQEASDFELAVSEDRKVMWRAFLKTWPEGRHHIEAAIRLRACK